MSDYDVFLSYNSRDEEKARQICGVLERRDLKVFFDRRDLIPGQRRQEKLSDVLEKIRAIAVLIGKDGLSPWQTVETQAAVEQAVNRGASAIPILLEGTSSNARPSVFLSLFVHVDEKEDDWLERLVRGIKAAAPDLRPYLRAVRDLTDHINVRGIASGGEALRQPIERLFTPLRCRGFGGGDLRELKSVLPGQRRLLIEGQPGAGKTTFLHFVAALLARDALNEPPPNADTWRQGYLGLDPTKPVPIPVFVRLSQLALEIQSDTSGRIDDRRWLVDYLTKWCAVNELGVDRDDWETLVDDGRVLLLLDGLDELANEDLRVRLFNVFRDATKDWKKTPIVVTSRPFWTTELRKMGFEWTSIEPFGEAEIRTFIDRWVTALHTTTADDLGVDGEIYRQTLTDAIVGRPRIRLLAANPVMLTCLCVVHWNEGRLPEGRSRVYQAVIRWLIAARREQREEAGFNNRFAKRAFARLALVMMTAEGGMQTNLGIEDAAVAIDEIVRRDFPGLKRDDRHEKARLWLRFESMGSGIVEELAGGRIRFWHLTFLEYLAAVQLARLDDGSDDPEECWWPILRDRLTDAQWRETVELVPGCLLDKSDRSVDRLLNRVLDLRGESPDLATEARVAGIFGRLLAPLRVYNYEPQPEIASAWEAARDAVMEIFTLGGVSGVPIEDRVAAAEALGQGGDPRLTPGLDNLISVPGQTVRLGRYPVTVEEYQRFVEAGCYEEREYWDAEGWKIRTKKGWMAPDDWTKQLQAPNCPVVLVSWYEAMAYCSWLSSQWGVEVRLPTVDEWYAVAEPEQGEYPWGVEEPDADRANFGRNVDRPTPVGVYPAGTGRYGHCDLAGNVWDWCVDRQHSEIEDTWMLQGGSWISPPERLRVTYSFWFRGSGRDRVTGFRLCCPCYTDHRIDAVDARISARS